MKEHPVQPILRGTLAGLLFAASLTGPAAFAADDVLTDRLRDVEPTSQTFEAPVPDILRLTAGFAKLFRVEGGVSTIVVGDPGVADASPLDSGTILLSGRSAGATNMIALDESGSVLVELMLHVSARQPGTVTVHRALDVQVYSCATGLCQGASAEGAAAATDPAAALP